ncbi:MAG: hypothetical protein NZ651_06225 [Candidatus Bipolaricaulota bacterium]|nr:hypothetical protein [Candidatus Bipolaricaulota bacterium]MDW8127350.1 hypothetical protein [Candidatus Bipolaricaulota bacterium]
MWREVKPQETARALSLKNGICSVRGAGKNGGADIIAIPLFQLRAAGFNGQRYFALYVDEENRKIGLQLFDHPPKGRSLRRLTVVNEVRFVARSALRMLGASPGYYRWSLDRERNFIVVDLNDPVPREKAVDLSHGGEDE